MQNTRLVVAVSVLCVLILGSLALYWFTLSRTTTPVPTRRASGMVFTANAPNLNGQRVTIKSVSDAGVTVALADGKEYSYPFSTERVYVIQKHKEGFTKYTTKYLQPGQTPVVTTKVDASGSEVVYGVVFDPQ